MCPCYSNHDCPLNTKSISDFDGLQAGSVGFTVCTISGKGVAFETFFMEI